MRARGALDNHDRSSRRALFARVKLDRRRALSRRCSINDSAIGTDQDLKYVLVVGSDNTIEYRQVKLGPVVDGLRVVREGLPPGDTIVVNGLQLCAPA